MTAEIARTGSSTAIDPVVADAHRMPAAAVVAALRSDAARGLSDAEARARLERFGRNELPAERRTPAWRRFVAQFEDVLILLLLVATAVSFTVWLRTREAALPYEAMAIFAIVLLNAIMGFVQESRAEAAVAALREMSAAEAAVVRDGERRRIPAAELVPGDIVLVEEGDTIPADGRLLESVSLRTAEAALTGESLPVSKRIEPLPGDTALGDRTNMVFAGTAASYGRARGVVTATGAATEMGRIAGLLRDAPAESTPLQRELDTVGRRLGLAVVVVAIVMIATLVLVQDVRGVAALADVLILGVALAVAAVPEGLPAVVTAVLSMGVARMARRNAIVRHLPAVETLGSATVIATDKTGTLTRNEMAVRAVVTASGRFALGGAGYAPEGEVRQEGGAAGEPARLELSRTLEAAERANNAALERVDGRWTIHGDPTEGALLVAARKAGLEERALDERLPRIGEVPFSSERKLMSTMHEDRAHPGRVALFTKGAPDVLLAQCTHELVGSEAVPLTEARRAAILAANEALAGEALRTLGVARRSLPAAADGGVGSALERELVFLGLVGMIDPPRDEAREAVARAVRAGIRPVMITGDHPVTAAVIARELGIAAAGAVTGIELRRLSDDALARTVREASIYARVNPEDKLRLVEALRRDGSVVAMTGDGVNDAPALQAADIGVAMGIAGTDVSKQAADIVLADDNFATIVAAVEEGRGIFANIRKFLRYLLSSNIGEVTTMFFGVVLAGTLGLDAQGEAVVLPLLATQVLWINLVTDGLPALALGVDAADPDVMERPPRPRGEGVITRAMWRGIFLVGVVMAAGTLLVLDASLPGGLLDGVNDVAYGQTMAFTTLVLGQLFNVFNARSDERSAFHGMFDNRWLLGAVAAALALQAAVVYLPPLQEAFGTVALTPGDWVRCAVPASAVLWVREASKLVGR
jgi:Ca2+-transporting ATPase